MIEVLHSVMYCSVQDKGRFGVAKQGIPQAGYLDSSAAALANVLLKNNEKDAVLEITFGQGTFKFKTATYICITGANFSPKLNGQASCGASGVLCCSRYGIVFWQTNVWRKNLCGSSRRHTIRNSIG